MKKLTLLGVLIFCIGASVTATTIHIPADQPAIQQGINMAVNGDTVLVSPGIYLEHLDFSGKGITVKSEQGASLTTIAKASDGLPMVKFVSGETHQAVLEGFTIIGANSVYGGIEIRYSSPIIRYNAIKYNRGNEPYDATGGIYCWQSHALIVNNRIENNVSALYGAGIHLHYSDDTVVNNIIAHNSGVQMSGIRSGLSKAVILNNLIAFNQNLPGYSATGAWFDDTIWFENNIIYKNSPMGVGLTSSASVFDYNDV